MQKEKKKKGTAPFLHYMHSTSSIGTFINNIAFVSDFTVQIYLLAVQRHKTLVSNNCADFLVALLGYYTLKQQQMIHIYYFLQLQRCNA